MKIAFIILAHKNPTYLQRLINHLTISEAQVFLHVDRGVPSLMYQAIQQALISQSQVTWLPRYYSHWGSWGLVRASLAGLKKALAVGCDYALLLSGQDYPLRPMGDLTQFLAAHKGISFLQHYAFASGEWPIDGYKRLTRWHFNLEMPAFWFRKKLNNGLIKLFNRLWPDRPFPAGLEAYGGSQWWCLHRPCIEYLVQFTEQNPQVVNFFKYVRIPDEAFFHTILLNSPWRHTLHNRSLTYVDWAGPPYPRVLGQVDLATLATADYFFARKFEPSVDALILDQIDQHLLAMPTT